jgi:hypothetical protein
MRNWRERRRNSPPCKRQNILLIRINGMTIPSGRKVEQIFGACVLDKTWLRESDMLKKPSSPAVVMGQLGG